jgi:ethanolamine utilization protein EutP (predicted NTPase)
MLLNYLLYQIPKTKIKKVINIITKDDLTQAISDSKKILRKVHTIKSLQHFFVRRR